MENKEVALVAVLLAAGTVLQYVLCLLKTLLTPDVITAFLCLSIIIFRPKMHEALGIGLVAGFLSMLVPGSILPPANLVSGPAGAYGCYYFIELTGRRMDWAPLITTFAATLVSGCTFVAIVTLVRYAAILSMYSGSISAFIVAYIPLIVGTAVLNAVIVQVLANLTGGARERGTGDRVP